MPPRPDCPRHFSENRTRIREVMKYIPGNGGVRCFAADGRPLGGGDRVEGPRRESLFG